MPPGTTCSPTSKDTTIVSGSIPPSGISPPNRQSAKPLNPVSAKSGESIQHYVQHGPAHAECATLLCPVRARGDRRAGARQDRGLQAQGPLGRRTRAARLSLHRQEARRGARGGGGG